MGALQWKIGQTNRRRFEVSLMRVSGEIFTYKSFFTAELFVRQEVVMAQYVLCAKVYILIEKEKLKP